MQTVGENNCSRYVAQEKSLGFTKTPHKCQSPYPKGNEWNDKEPNRKYKTKAQKELQDMACFHSHPNYELLKRKPCWSILSIDGGERKRMFAYLEL